MNTIHPGNLPLQAGGLKLDNPHMAVSAIKKAEDRESLILRLYSLSDKAETVEVSGFPLQEAYMANLKEERIRRLENGQESVRLEVKAREIVTLELVG
jgi:alpha-mannosidase